MKKLTFRCTLLSDLVISSSGATEGFKQSLDYIPGAKFLGIVAKDRYDMEQAQQTLDLFHNGCVRFGDAHPLVNGKITYRPPLSWYYPKSNGYQDQIYLYHLIGDPEEQLVQVRRGYITEQLEKLFVDQTFSLKSAYDAEKRRAKDKQIFGYSSLIKDSQWGFEVEIEDNQYEDFIINSLTGKHRIGKSSSAQYGLIQIDYLKDVAYSDASSEGENEEQKRLFIYAASNLCFYDKLGNNTLEPTLEDLHLPKDASINWKLSQIRTRKYPTWNKKRNSRNADRYVIEKGSVLVVDATDSSLNLAQSSAVIGSHRAEGMGRVLLNPVFLKNNQGKPDLILLNNNEPSINLSADEVRQDRWKAAQDTKPLEGINKRIWDYLQAKSANQVSVDAKVNAFINDNNLLYEGVTSSQWGQIRNISRNTANSTTLNTMLFGEDVGFLYKGKSRHIWTPKRVDKLYQFVHALEQEQRQIGIIRLATELSKYYQ
ncbi:MAG: hypothetical protein AAF655_23680 [Bacteroidota bacterium]